MVSERDKAAAKRILWKSATLPKTTKQHLTPPPRKSVLRLFSDRAVAAAAARRGARSRRIQQTIDGLLVKRVSVERQSRRDLIAKPRGVGNSRAAILVLALSTASHAEPCQFEKHQVTLQGTIVQSAFGRTPYMALVTQHPSCDEETMVEVDASKKWLGHHVTITGDLGAMADREWYLLTIKSIKDTPPITPRIFPKQF
jgi:hypothetical protein